MEIAEKPTFTWDEFKKTSQDYLKNARKKLKTNHPAGGRDGGADRGGGRDGGADRRGGRDGGADPRGGRGEPVDHQGGRGDAVNHQGGRGGAAAQDGRGPIDQDGRGDGMGDRRD